MSTAKELPKITTGYRVGKLTVAGNTSEKRSGYTVWQCKCDCGGEIRLDTRCLQRGAVTDCGCVSTVRPGQRDLSGQRFGRLVCVAPTEERGSSGGVVWQCRCDCGNACLAVSTQLLAGYKKSCGCLGHPPIKNYKGLRFGKLTVTEYAGKKSGMHRWKCRCDCGNETTVGQTLLQSGKTQSCGCLQTAIITENLKLCNGTSVTKLQSMKNKTMSTNTSGYTGVYQNKRTGKWIAQITFQKKTYYLGSYEKIEDAIKARRCGEEMHDEFLDWYFETQKTEILVKKE